MWSHVVELTGMSQWMKRPSGPSQGISNEKKKKKLLYNKRNGNFQ
jgi:hypothetical protein